MKIAIFILSFLIIGCANAVDNNHSLYISLTTEAQERLLLPEDLEYLGAFRFPETPGQASRWAFGGSGLTYYPKGDSTGSTDGFPGSLYSIGHDHHQLVSEISIPKPVVSEEKNAAELPVAGTVQQFADITDGLREQAGVDKVGDLAYLPKQGEQRSDKIYWTIYEYYNAAGIDYLSHGWSELDLSRPQAKGVWHLGPLNSSNREFHSMKTADFLFDIPMSWANQYVDGKYLASGRHRANGAFGSSEGPALYAFAPYQEGNPPEYGAELEAIPLLWYPELGEYFPNYRACDRWDGGAWLTTGQKSAVIIGGRKSLGEEYYGAGRGNDCESARGYHCSPYESQLLFYDPQEFEKVIAGEKEPHQVVPYAVFRPAEYFWPSCSGDLGGMAFDRERGYLYVIQKSAENVTNEVEFYPLVHVFKVSANSADGNPGNQENNSRFANFNFSNFRWPFNLSGNESSQTEDGTNDEDDETSSPRQQYLEEREEIWERQGRTTERLEHERSEEAVQSPELNERNTSDAGNENTAITQYLEEQEEVWERQQRTAEVYEESKNSQQSMQIIQRYSNGEIEVIVLSGEVQEEDQNQNSRNEPVEFTFSQRIRELLQFIAGSLFQ